MPRSKLAVFCKTYYNAGSYDTPTWTVIPQINDTLNLGLSKDEVDTTDREDAGWETVMGGVRKCPVDFKIPWTPADSVFSALWTAWTSDDDSAVLEMLIMDGAYDTAGTKGIRAYMEILDFKRVEEKNGKVNAEITMKPAKSDTDYAAPSVFTGSE